MIIVFHARLDGRFIEINHNLKRKKLHRVNKRLIFLVTVLAIETIQVPQSNLEEKDNPTILKFDFSSKIDPFIIRFSNDEMKQVKFSQHRNTVYTI